MILMKMCGSKYKRYITVFCSIDHSISKNGFKFVYYLIFIRIYEEYFTLLSYSGCRIGLSRIEIVQFQSPII